MSTPRALINAEYLNLATFRRSGKQVNTPVWAAEENGVFYIFSAGDAGKVKRINNSGRARIAPCSYKGELLGEWHEAQGRIITDLREIENAYRVIRAKYGWKVRVFDFFSKLGGAYYKRALLAVNLN